MNEKIKDHLVKFCAAEGFKTGDDTLHKVLREAEIIYSKLHSKHRWWDTYFTVVRIDGMLVGFIDGKTTGDDSAEEKGWEFDPSTICEVEAHEKTITVYEQKK